MVDPVKIHGFASLVALQTALKDAKVVGRLGGAKVRLKVISDSGTDKTIFVSRNQLAKIAVKLAEREKKLGQNVVKPFGEIKTRLGELDEQHKGNKIRQRIGNAFFKLTHHGKNRAEYLQSKENELIDEPRKNSANWEAGAKVPEGMDIDVRREPRKKKRHGTE
jgi:hypothetical protein